MLSTLPAPLPVVVVVGVVGEIAAAAAASMSYFRSLFRLDVQCVRRVHVEVHSVCK